jgi:hypothetical protein
MKCVKLVVSRAGRVNGFWFSPAQSVFLFFVVVIVLQFILITECGH